MQEIILNQYVVDAFTEHVFSGNPAAVCVLDTPISTQIMQKIAIENNLSETAFNVKLKKGQYSLRWFTPGGEIDLCGHATLASAFIIMNFVEPDIKNVTFETMSGKLVVNRNNDLFEMDMPSYILERVPVTDEMEKAIGFRPVEAWLSRDLVCIMENEAQVRNAKPDKERLMKLDGLLLNITAKGSDYDCVTRSFAPKLNVWEDPVCGSGHCHVIPLWADKLGKSDLVAYQASKRGGVLYCSFKGERILVSGKACLYSEAQIHVPTDTE